MDLRNSDRVVIERFNKERNEAFLSLDEEKIRTHQRKWNDRELPEDKKVFWAAVHKAITGVRELPLEFRKQSKAYLDARGLRSFDDGDL